MSFWTTYSPVAPVLTYGSCPATSSLLTALVTPLRAAPIKTIIKILGVEKRTNKAGKEFYLNYVLLEDGEEYSLAHDKPAKVGDKVQAWYDDFWDRPKASYGGKIDG